MVAQRLDSMQHGNLRQRQGLAIEKNYGASQHDAGRLWPEYCNLDTRQSMNKAANNKAEVCPTIGHHAGRS